MRKKCFAAFVVMTLAAFVIAPQSILNGQDSVPKGHNWSSIVFPRLASSSEDRFAPTMSLRNFDGLRFSLEYYIPADATAGERELPPVEAISLRIHTTSQIIESKLDENGVGIGDLSGSSYRYSYRLPWGPNLMEDAWIELRLPERIYWIELPYGFSRNPADPMKLDDAMVGAPEFAPAMKDLEENAQLVPWLSVHYDLGKIQNNWGLSVSLSNPYSAEAEIFLYRDDGAIGKSIYLWEVHSPRTAISIKDSDEQILNGREMAIRLHEEGYRRSDTFKFKTYPVDERTWGAATIKVDDKSYEFVVPSSLFKYGHGVANPDHKAWIARPTDD